MISIQHELLYFTFGQGKTHVQEVVSSKPSKRFGMHRCFTSVVNNMIHWLGIQENERNGGLGLSEPKNHIPIVDCVESYSVSFDSCAIWATECFERYNFYYRNETA